MIWVIIIVVAIILAFIGYVADKNGYFAKKEENLETVDFSELSRPKDLKSEIMRTGKEIVKKSIGQEKVKKILKTKSSTLEEISLTSYLKMKKIKVINVIIIGRNVNVINVMVNLFFRFIKISPSDRILMAVEII